ARRSGTLGDSTVSGAGGEVSENRGYEKQDGESFEKFQCRGTYPSKSSESESERTKD
ncbi:hypothetical protein A2U01_0083091, partial [Trifolium medium]|nr:hypothetical protein [Trifolium medium]